MAFDALFPMIVKMPSTDNQVEPISAKQVLKLSPIPVFVPFVIEGQNLEVNIGLGI